METYTRKKFIKDFAELHDLNYETAKMYVDSVATLIIEGLKSYDRVVVWHLGIFSKLKAKPKKIYDFGKKELVDVPEHNKVRFLPWKNLRKEIY